MSGQQIGTVIGGIVGAYFGMPQLGMAIGGLIGGAIDPTKINGPHLGDAQQQTATDGSVIAWVLGTATVAGTIVQVSERREVKVKDSGKGGPEVSHYEGRQDFCILVCESSETRNSVVSSVLMVEQDGKIVYDVRPGSSMLSDSAKWKANVDFQFGSESQLPHPTMEAITGVGNTCAYRGVLTAVFKNFNTSAAGGRIPAFKFTVSSGAQLIAARSQYRYIQMVYDDHVDYSGPDFDDRSWSSGNAPFAGYGNEGNPSWFDAAAAYDQDFLSGSNVWWPPFTVIWLRANLYVDRLYTTLQLKTFMDDHMDVYINGTKVLSTSSADGGHGTIYNIPASALVIGRNVVALKLMDESDGGGGAGSVVYFDMKVYDTGGGITGSLPLSEIVRRIAKRGGIDDTDIDVADFTQILVQGYPIGRQSSASDCLLPLLQAYFAYSSEYDNQLHFKFYGEDTVLEVSEDDLIESSDSNNGAITETKRNQATEFPRKITVSYYDPTQNYMVVNVTSERLAADVVAIGEQKMDVPVVMNPDVAQRASDRAMKVAYATLEGTRNYLLPYARSAAYISVCAGESVAMSGKRWTVDQVDLMQGALKFSTRYDRQSAYRSNVEAIRGLPPSTPASRYSGPTVLYAMNLPSLRPQDTYGLYIAVASIDGRPSWRGCDVQISYDGQLSWQAAATAVVGSTLGTVTDAEPSGGEPLTVDVDGTGDLETVTDAQIAAQANAFALINGDAAEIGQFKTADLNSDGTYDLSDISRGLKGTTEVPAIAGQKFTMLDSVYFLPIDLSFKGETIALRAVGFGEAAEDATIVTIVYNPDTTIIHDGGEIT